MERTLFVRGATPLELFELAHAFYQHIRDMPKDTVLGVLKLGTQTAALFGVTAPAKKNRKKP